MEHWIEFQGKSVDGDDELVLQSDHGGAIAARRADVMIRDGKVHLRHGARVRLAEAPPEGHRPASIEVPGERADRPTYSVGFVMICCETGAVLGQGLGFWNDCRQA